MPKKEKQSKLGMFLVGFIAFIMISSIAGFLHTGVTNSVRYKGVKFTATTHSGWVTSLNGQQISFQYLPADVDYFEIPSDVKTAIGGKPQIDTTSDLEDFYVEDIALAQFEMSRVMSLLDTYMRRGFTTNNSFNLPIVTCADATPTVPVLYFRAGNETQVFMDGNCIVAEATDSTGILIIKDRLVYHLMGIIE